MPFQRKSEKLICWFSRLSFPHLFTATPIVRQGQPIGEPFFSTIVILHDEIVERIRAVEARLIAQSWPEWGPAGEPPPGITLKHALKRGETVRAKDPHLAGKWVLSANAKKNSKPWVVTKDHASGNYLPVTDESLVYAGCEGHVSVGLYTTQIQAAAPQIDVGLNGVELTLRPMPSFESRLSAEQALGSGPDVAAPPPPPGSPDVVTPNYYPGVEADLTGPSYDPADPMTW